MLYKECLLYKRQIMENMKQESSINSQYVDCLSLQQDLCGPIAATMHEAMYSLVISKWREASDSVKITNDYKFLAAAGSLFMSMVRMLDLVMNLLPEDSKECQTARVLLYKLFYDQTDEGLTQFLLNRFKCFDSHKQARSDLADLLETIHIMLRLMEKLQAKGTLRVSKKFRRKRVKNKALKGMIEVESELIKEPEIAREHLESASEMCINPAMSVKENHLELNSVEREQDFKLEGSFKLSPAVEPDIPLQNTEPQHNLSSAVPDDGENEKPADQEYETNSSSNTEEPATNEVNFNVTRLVSSFASNTIIHNLCWLLKHYKANSSSTNHYILCMLRRFCEDLELSPMLYQLSLLSIFYDILAEQKTCKSREYMNIINFLTKFIRNMFKMMKSQPLLFVEILFWKTRRECQYFNAEALMESIGNLRKYVRKKGGDPTDAFHCHREMGCKNIADALGEDEIDLDLPQLHRDQRADHSSDSVDGNSHRTKLRDVKASSATRTSKNEINEDTGEITPSSPLGEGTSRRDNHPNFTKEQDTIIHELYENNRRKRIRAFSLEEEKQITILYEKFKSHKKRNVMIANTLNPDKKFTAGQISRKLKQLGLLPHRRSSSTSGKHEDGDEIGKIKDKSDEETLLAIRERSKTKKRVPGIVAPTMDSSPQLNATPQEHDSEDWILSSFKDASSKRKIKSSVEDQVDSEAVDKTWLINNTPVEIDEAENYHISEISASNQGMPVGHSELEDSIDSGDDMSPLAPRKIGARKRMILDFEEDDDD